VLNAQLPARRRAAVALVVLAASAAFGVADAGATDPNATDNTNAGCRYIARPARSIPASLRRAAMMCALNRARKANSVAALRLSVPLSRAASTHATRSVALKWWDRSNPLASHVNPQTGTVALQRDVAAKYCLGGQPTVSELTYSGGGGTAGSPSAAANFWLNDPAQRLALLHTPGLDAGPGIAPGSAYNPADPEPAGTYVVDFGRCTR